MIVPSRNLAASCNSEVTGNATVTTTTTNGDDDRQPATEIQIDMMTAGDEVLRYVALTNDRAMQRMRIQASITFPRGCRDQPSGFLDSTMPTPAYDGRVSALRYTIERRADCGTPSSMMPGSSEDQENNLRYGKSNKLLISPDVGKLFIAGDVHFLARFTALRQVAIA
ncbi:hypothetical protein SCLCIDRAFT_1219489 [Scleroderma citrinum Foug A]|uniref:Uncharacterized protein n=1 Tax=Scleroderma citrinum Foug A TaxID=1036808 RepID=A0A0C2ZY97_9AGAM|nr:hypothetical protein SCLCIDRAFT_1219489 [Scleroderma citrinum Foug A]